VAVSTDRERVTSDYVRAVTKADIFTACVGVLALVAGAVLLVAGEGTLASIVGAVLLGLAGIAFVALVFLLVGESEDRDRGNGTL
jgi:divalent metal cation (Fe/Co/Zn/Cd) transporter